MRTNEFTLYYNNVRENNINTVYPYGKRIKSEKDLKQVVACDHVCAAYRGNKRKNDNFIQADCIMLDVDNTESDNQNEWKTAKDIKKAFPNVPFYVSYSRNHLKSKGNKTPRPKFHVYFAINPIYELDEYVALKRKICYHFPYFDFNAKDGARLFYGVATPKIEYCDGEILLSDFMKDIPDGNKERSNEPKLQNEEKTSSKQNQYVAHDIIHEGNRKTYMTSYAARVLKRYGDKSDEALQSFLNEANKCQPHLENNELNSIWRSSLKFYNQTIKTAPDYISPEEFKRRAKGRKSTPYQDVNDSEKYCLQPVNISELNFLLNKDHDARHFNIENARHFLGAFGLNIRKNEMNGCNEVTGMPEKYKDDNILNNVVTIISDLAGSLSYTGATQNKVFSILDVIATENRYHPVLSLLSEDKWDGLDRLPAIYEILGLTDDFHKVLIKKWALQTIAVLYNSKEHPISAQGLVVLQGNQAVGKTEFFRHLAIKNDFFREGATLDMSNKDTIISATKVWICELGEIDSTTKKEQSALKGFLTKQFDSYREPYERKAVERPRRTSFCGTVNPKWYLNDITGNRRYWTIPIKKINKDKIFSLSQEWYTQFWRQIQKEYLENPKCYLLTAEEQEKINATNIDFEVDTYGEDDFISFYDTEADHSMWVGKTAAEIANELNENFKGLNISSVSVGKQLIKKLEDRLGVEFTRKRINGKNYIMCPPKRICEPEDMDIPQIQPRSYKAKSEDLNADEVTADFG